MFKKHLANSILVLILLQFSVIGCFFSSNNSEQDSYLVLYAFKAEGELLSELMNVQRIDNKLGRNIYLGTLSGKNIILAESGIGMTNASMTTQCMIDSYNPKAVLFTGIAGGIDSSISIGDIVVPEIWIQHDYGYYGSNGLEHNSIKVYVPEDDSISRIDSFLVDNKLLKSLQNIRIESINVKLIGNRVPKLVVGGVGVSGNAFIDNIEKRLQLLNDYNALVTDMESSAVAQVCFVNKKPVIILRSASDLAGGSGSETAHEQISEFFKVAAFNSANVLMEVLEKL